MSTRALTHVFYNVHIRPGAKLVLLAIADTADDDGDNAWPSVATLARKASVHPRSVQRAINELVEMGLLTVVRGAGPPGTNYYRVHMPALERLPVRVSPRVRGDTRTGSGRGEERAARPDDSAAGSAVGTVGGAAGAVDGSVDNPVDKGVDGSVDNPAERVDKGVTTRHPGDLPGVTGEVVRGGISPRGGDTGATRTSHRTTTNPRARARVKPRTGGAVDDGRRDDEGEYPELDARRVLTELGPRWALSPHQVDALLPTTLGALRCGWSVDELIAHLSARPDGVRSPVAVLMTRLREATTPGRRSRRGSRAPARPPWCRDDTCDPDTRLRETADGPRSVLHRCPVCHPTTVRP